MSYSNLTYSSLDKGSNLGNPTKINMPTVLRVMFFTLSVFFCILDSTAVSDDRASSRNAEEAARQSRRSEVFEELRRMFPNPILDEDFKTLKQVTRSKVYLDYLKSEFPTGEPFETLEAFMNVAPPPVERYRNFLNKHFENVTEMDFLGIHQLTLIDRRVNMMLLSSKKTGNAKYGRAATQLSSFKLLPDHLRRRLETIDPTTIWSFRLKRDHARLLWESRFREADRAERRRFISLRTQFAVETEKADTDWIQAQFETHGQDEGLLWIAVENPILIGEIITNFPPPRTELFLTWVEQTFILKMLSLDYSK